MFTEQFDRTACEGDRIGCVVDGFTVTARIERDDHSGPPWQEHDGHGPVSDWTSRAKRAGERVLIQDRGSYRYYDFAEAVRIARSGGWDAEPFGTGTAGERAARAAERDFRVLQAWCDDTWFWCGIVVTVSRENVQLTPDYGAALWGIECNYPDGDNSYLSQIANELLDEALAEARARLTALCGCEPA
jgi:hypothetical protein